MYLKDSTKKRSHAYMGIGCSSTHAQKTLFGSTYQRKPFGVAVEISMAGAGSIIPDALYRSTTVSEMMDKLITGGRW
ncbi:hypothetical protein NIES2100_36880 [Calothrix sp. NIES-2100]|uniref:hypothetical protein n=1 Tax=Calothrix sp. NIES-2100 TaxID=1954172 RepID=UPI000B61CC3E|nr:hypothetical protein NIES2100_36880 [Calothrix sp. NIES-2100]